VIIRPSDEDISMALGIIENVVCFRPSDFQECLDYLYGKKARFIRIFIDALPYTLLIGGIGYGFFFYKKRLKTSGKKPLRGIDH
jgi:hypothetical protein